MAEPIELDRVTWADQHSDYDLLLLQQKKLRWEAVPVMRRDGGFLLGVPPGAFPASRLTTAQKAGAKAALGPSKEVDVHFRGADGDEEEDMVKVLLIDVADSMAAQLFPYQDPGEDLQGFSVSDQRPDGEELLQVALEWVGAPDEPRLSAYVTATEGDGAEAPNGAAEADGMARYTVEDHSDGDPGAAEDGAAARPPALRRTAFRPAPAPARPTAAAARASSEAAAASTPRGAGARPSAGKGRGPSSQGAQPAEDGAMAEILSTLKGMHNEMSQKSQRLDRLEGKGAKPGSDARGSQEVLRRAAEMAGKPPRTRTTAGASGGRGSGGPGAVAATAEEDDLLEEELEEQSTDQLFKMAVLKMLTGKGKKKRIPGLGIVDSDSEGEEDGLGHVGGARHTMALEKLHGAMRKHPGDFATRMENLAAEVLGKEVSEETGLEYVLEALPVGRQKTLGYLMVMMGLIHRAARRKQLEEVRFLSMASVAMAEQFSLDENWTAAWKIFGQRIPPWTGWAQEDLPQLRKDHVHSRLVDARWTGAAVGAFKDEETLRKRRGKGGAKGKEETATG